MKIYSQWASERLIMRVREELDRLRPIEKDDIKDLERFWNMLRHVLSNSKVEKQLYKPISNCAERSTQLSQQEQNSRSKQSKLKKPDK